MHEIYREWRQVFNEYEPARFAVGEAWVVPEHQWMYASTEELGQVFNFELAKAIWMADEMRLAIEEGLDSAGRSGSTTTWVLSNHDVVRHATRYGLPQVKSAAHHQLANDWLLRDGRSYREDRELGTRRARAALLMELGLPGSVYLYQGEELGLFEVADIPWDALEDPQATMTAHGDALKGRDGCRVPLPWEAEKNDFGFSSPKTHAPAHLPQPAWFAGHAVDAEETDEGSMLHYYRRALALRAELLTATGDTSLTWVDGYDDQVIAYRRPTADGRALTSVTNFGARSVELPEGEVLLASAELSDGKLPTDATAWVIR